MVDIQFKLNTVITTAPRNWKDLEITISRDDITNGLLRTFTSSLEWFGAAYDILRTAKDLDFCDSVTCEIEIKKTLTGSFTTLFEGTIFLTDIVWNHLKCVANAAVEDDSFTAKIANNRQIQVGIGISRSKNDVDYSGSFQATNQVIDFFIPSTGVYPASLVDVECYTAAEVLEDIVRFCTDDTMTFTNNVTALDILCICTGAAINDAGTEVNRPFISFDEWFSEVGKKYNIGFSIDDSGPTPDFVLDTLDNIYAAATSHTFTNVREIDERIDRSLLYSKVIVGGEEDELAGSWPNIRYFNHKGEEYHLEGICNTDNVLNLESQWIISSNVIELIVDGVVAASKIDTFDEDIFLIDTDLPGGSRATDFDNFNLTIAPFNYNNLLTNREVIPRFQGVIFSSLIIFLGDGNDGFEATKTVSTPDTAPLTVIARVDYDNEISDPNVNYDNAVGQFHYTAPVDGFYRFSCSIDVSNVVINALEGVSLDVQLTQQRRPSGGGAPFELKSDSQIITTSQTVTFEPTGFFLEALEEVNITVTVDDTGPGPGTNSYDLDGGTFKTTEVETGGGTFETFDPDDARVLFFDFPVPLPLADFETIAASPTEKLVFNISRSGTTKGGWIKELKYLVYDKRAEISIITTHNET